MIIHSPISSLKLIFSLEWKMLGWLIIDGLGLSIIATCTIMEGFEL